MHRHLGNLLRTALVCSALLLGAGCGDQEPDDRPTSTTASSTPTPTPTQPPTPSGTQTTPPTDGLQKIRVVGVVERTGDCVVVRDDNDITWTITGPAADDLTEGTRVAVTGTPSVTGLGCGGPIVQAARVSRVG